MRGFFGYDGIRHCTNKQDFILRKKRLNGRLRSLTNPADFRRDLLADGGEDGCARVESVGGFKRWAVDSQAQAEALLRRALSQHCAAIVSGREAAKFLDSIVEAFDQVARSVNGPAVGNIVGPVRFDGPHAPPSPYPPGDPKRQPCAGD
jgi:hypothetical protein